LVFTVVIASAFLFETAQKQSTRPQLMRANNLGVAYMNQQKLDQALKEFQEAAALDKNNATVQLNLGIALLNLSRVAPAEEALQRTAQLEPKNPAVWFNFGLLHRNNGEAERALADFTKAAEFAPNDPNTHYFLGDLYAQQQKYAEAEREFRRAVELDPFSVSSEFGLARALQRQGKTAEAKPHYERFQKLTREKLGAPISQIYGEQGPLSLARVIPGEPTVPAAIPVRFVELGSDSGLPVPSPKAGAEAPSFPPPGICVYDIDQDGKPDILLANGMRPVALFLNRGNGKFEDATKAAGLDGIGGRTQGAIGCAIGDYDNDGKPDIALTTLEKGIVLLHNDGGKFTDKTKIARLDVAQETTRKTVLWSPMAVTFVDYDHDGDLDLYVTRTQLNSSKGPIVTAATAGPPIDENILLRNNGDGTFTDVTTETAMQGDGLGMSLASDVNND